jgi:hypothetical protein
MLLVDYESGTTSQDFAQTGEYITPTNGLSTTTLSVTSVVFSNDGTYTFKVSFGNAGTPFSGIYPFEETYIYFDVEIESGSIVSTHVDTPYSPTYGEPQSLPCSLTQLQGCLINTANFLFYPSTASIDAFMTEYDQLENKLPFVYAYQASDLLTDMYTGTASSVPAITVTTGIGDITLISESQLAAIPYVSLIRSLIAAGLWLMLFTVLYRKTLSIHDKQTV